MTDDRIIIIRRRAKILDDRMVNMPNNSRYVRLTILFSAFSALLISLLIVFFVIPPARTDTFPLATPDSAVGAFWVNAVIHFFIALILLTISLRLSTSKKRYAGIYALLGGLFLFLSFALMDAAIAYRAHGPDLAVVSTLLFVCTILGSLSGIAQIVIAILPRKMKETS